MNQGDYFKLPEVPLVPFNPELHVERYNGKTFLAYLCQEATTMEWFVYVDRGYGWEYKSVCRLKRSATRRIRGELFSWIVGQNKRQEGVAV